MTPAFHSKAPNRYIGVSLALSVVFLTCAIVFACLVAPGSAHAVTAAEKQAEADAVWAQIDSLQTSLNEAMAAYDAAQGAYEEATRLRDEAARQIEEETTRIDTLQDELSGFAVSMYKQGGSSSFIDVVLQSASFEEFLTSWDVCTTISNRGATLIRESKRAREALEAAKATYEKEGKRAEQEMASADQKRQQIEDTQAALAAEAAKLDEEAAELARKEELAAEAARQAALAAEQRQAMIASGEAGASVISGNGYFTHPCPGAPVSSGFGYRTFDYSFHMGTDFAAAEGTPYYAADSGTVIYATYDGGYNGGAGNWIVITHGNGIVTKYMHSSAVYVAVGQYVERGQNIGAVGNTGNSFGAHLHFQVEVNGVAVDALNYL